MNNPICDIVQGPPKLPSLADFDRLRNLFAKKELEKFWLDTTMMESIENRVNQVNQEMMELICGKDMDKEMKIEDRLFLCARYDTNSLVRTLPTEVVFLILQVKQASLANDFHERRKEFLGCFLPKTDSIKFNLQKISEFLLEEEMNRCPIQLDSALIKVDLCFLKPDSFLCKVEDSKDQMNELSGEVYCSDELGVFSDSEVEISEGSEECNTMAIIEKPKKKEDNCQIQ